MQENPQDTKIWILSGEELEWRRAYLVACEISFEKLIPSKMEQLNTVKMFCFLIWYLPMSKSEYLT